MGGPSFWNFLTLDPGRLVKGLGWGLRVHAGSRPHWAAQPIHLLSFEMRDQGARAPRTPQTMSLTSYTNKLSPFLSPCLRLPVFLLSLLQTLSYFQCTRVHTHRQTPLQNTHHTHTHTHTYSHTRTGQTMRLVRNPCVNKMVPRIYDDIMTGHEGPELGAGLRRHMCSGFGVRVRLHSGLKLWAALEPSLTAPQAVPGQPVVKLANIPGSRLSKHPP